MQTIYVVETYKESGGEVRPERAVICRNDQDAIGRAWAFSASAVGVVAYSQDVDLDLGEYAEPIVLARYGEVPLESRAI